MGFPNPLAFLPDSLKRKLLDQLVEAIARGTERIAGKDVASRFRSLSSEAPLNDALDHAIEVGYRRFVETYTEKDEDLVDALSNSESLWKSDTVRRALGTLIRRPGSWLPDERDTLVQHFEDVLPQRVNRKRVDSAILELLHCVSHEFWNEPGAKEIRDIYNTEYIRLNHAALVDQGDQTRILIKQVEALSQFSVEVRQALLQVVSAMEQKALEAPAIEIGKPLRRPFCNLTQPDYDRFVGRETELGWLRNLLLPYERAWQILITGIGGVGKTALAQAIAYECREAYERITPGERFEAIIWISAQEETLTAQGRERAQLPTRVLRNLEDIYTAIAQTMEREDITRALPEDQHRLVEKALMENRTLLVIDNFESITDKRIKVFLRTLPIPTKAIITSRQWLDMADAVTLSGLNREAAETMMLDLSATRNINLIPSQIQRLHNLTSGLPLPIKLSIARMAGGDTFEAVAKWLLNSTGDLPEYCVRTQVELACRISDSARRLLLASALFDQESGSTQESLSYVAKVPDAEFDDSIRPLQHLMLINRTENERYWVLPIVQRFVRSQYSDRDMRDLLLDGWTRYFLKFVIEHGTDLQLHIEKVAIFSTEYSNVKSLIRWCDEHEQWDIVPALVEGTWFFAYVTGLFSELRELLDIGLRAAKRNKDEHREGLFEHHIGRLFWIQGQFDKSSEYFDRAEAIALKENSELELGRIWIDRTDGEVDESRLTNAEPLARKALEIGERFDDWYLKSLSAHRLADIETYRNNLGHAMIWLDKCEKWAREANSPRRIAWVLYRRGSNLILLGDMYAAESVLAESLSMGLTWGERRLIAYNKFRLAQIFAHTGRIDSARQAGEEARDLFERLGIERKMSHIDALLASIANQG